MCENKRKRKWDIRPPTPQIRPSETIRQKQAAARVEGGQCSMHPITYRTKTRRRFKEEMDYRAGLLCVKTIVRYQGLGFIFPPLGRTHTQPPLWWSVSSIFSHLLRLFAAGITASISTNLQGRGKTSTHACPLAVPLPLAFTKPLATPLAAFWRRWTVGFFL
jgi:hypothetical protein